MNYRIHHAGDQSILVEFERDVNRETNYYVRTLASLIENQFKDTVYETILGYKTVLIHYNPLKLSYYLLEKEINLMIEQLEYLEHDAGKEIEIPVLYGSHYGPDLEDVAQINDLTVEEVIKIHSGETYDVYFLGFSPGFPFLAGMSKKIATPRLANPRKKIEAGSVGIANDQTGIYPVSSPGGWRLIGRTPMKLYDEDKEWPFLLAPGDRLRFQAISLKDYEMILQSGDSNV